MWGISWLGRELLALQEGLGFVELVGWLVGWLVGRSVGWSVGWSVDWLVGWLISWFVGRSVDLFVCLFVAWLVDWLVGRSAGVWTSSILQCCKYTKNKPVVKKMDLFFFSGKVVGGHVLARRAILIASDLCHRHRLLCPSLYEDIGPNKNPRSNI
jgi:hypothetical protein